MSQSGVPAVGTNIVLSLDGQKVTGLVTAVQSDKLVVRLKILQPAKMYQGVRAKTSFPGGQEVQFDLGSAAYYSELLIEVPLPIGLRAQITPRPVAEIGGQQTAAAVAPSVPVAPEAVVKDEPAPVEEARPPGVPPAKSRQEAIADALAKPAMNREEASPPPPPPAPVIAKPPGDERRHYFRFAVDIPVQVVEDVGHRRDWVREEGRTMNLSGGGMLAEFDKPLPPGTYRFRIALPEEEMVMSGRVIKKGDGLTRVAAIEFIDLTEAQRSKLIRFIFNMMRNLRNVARGIDPASDGGEKQEKTEKTEEKAHRLRREKYFKPTKIRYW